MFHEEMGKGPFMKLPFILQLSVLVGQCFWQVAGASLPLLAIVPQVPERLQTFGSCSCGAFCTLARAACAALPAVPFIFNLAWPGSFLQPRTDPFHA